MWITTAALSGDTNPWALLALRFTSFQKDSVLQQRIWDHRFLAVSIAESINFFASDRPYSGQQPCGQSIHLRSPYQERKRRVNGMTRSTMVRSSAPVCSWPFGPTPTCRRRIADTLRRGPVGPVHDGFRNHDVFFAFQEDVQSFWALFKLLQDASGLFRCSNAHEQANMCPQQCPRWCHLPVSSKAREASRRYLAPAAAEPKS